MFDEFDDEYDEFVKGFEIGLRMFEFLFKVSFKMPYREIAKKILYMTNEFKPLWGEKEVPADD